VGTTRRENSAQEAIHTSEKRERKEGVQISGRWGPLRDRRPTIINRAWRPAFGIFDDLIVQH